MKEKLNKWTKGKRIGASLLVVTTMLLLSFIPVIHAEGRQSSIEETVTPNIIRYEGRSRENVAESVAKAHFKDSKKVIIVNREKFPDAISATNISQGEYPVLYTREGSVSDSTMELLESMTLDEIYVLGGELSVNKSVVKQLEEATNVKVTRVAGRSRYDANVSAVEEKFTSAKHVVIASGEVYSDALYGVSYANTIDAPVILTNTNQLQASTVELLKELGAESATIIGGPLTVTEAVEDQLEELEIEYERISGRNRYTGSAEVANEAYDNPEHVVVASGEVFSDALVSAPLAQKLDAPILLVRKDRMENVVENYLTSVRVNLENVYIQGGPLTILPTTENRIKELTTYERTTNVVRVQTVTEKFDTKEVEDDTILKGETEVIQEGKDGYQVINYEVVYINGKEVSRVEIDREEVAPIEEIIGVGTKVIEEDSEDSEDSDLEDEEESDENTDKESETE